MITDSAKILLVDDDPVVLATLTEQLNSAGYATEVAKHGQEAWQLLTTAPESYSLLILDRIMPSMDGMTLLSQLKQHPDLAELPVIILTGVAEHNEMVTAVKQGAYDFLYKPLDTDLLLKVVERALSEPQFC
jgi:DNA-binding NtrC family response regulator